MSDVKDFYNKVITEPTDFIIYLKDFRNIKHGITTFGSGCYFLWRNLLEIFKAAKEGAGNLRESKEYMLETIRESFPLVHADNIDTLYSQINVETEEDYTKFKECVRSSRWEISPQYFDFYTLCWRIQTGKIKSKDDVAEGLTFKFSPKRFTLRRPRDWEKIAPILKDIEFKKTKDVLSMLSTFIPNVPEVVEEAPVNDTTFIRFIKELGSEKTGGVLFSIWDFEKLNDGECKILIESLKDTLTSFGVKSINVVGEVLEVNKEDIPAKYKLDKFIKIEDKVVGEIVAPAIEVDCKIVIPATVHIK